MLSVDLKNQVLNLPISDRLELMQTIVASLQNHPLATPSIVTEPSVSDYFEPGKTYEVWTPIEAPGAAQVLLDLLAADLGIANDNYGQLRDQGMNGFLR